MASRNPSGDVSTSIPWVVRAHFFFTFSIFAFSYYKIHEAITISKEGKLCHCSNCMRKRVLRAGSWLGKIKISLSWFQQHFLKPSSKCWFLVALPHVRLNKQTPAGVMNGTGEADPLEIVRSEVRLPYLEPCVMASSVTS